LTCKVWFDKNVSAFGKNWIENHWVYIRHARPYWLLPRSEPWPVVAQVSQWLWPRAVVFNTPFPGATAAAGVLAASKRSKYKSQVPRIENS